MLGPLTFLVSTLLDNKSQFLIIKPWAAVDTEAEKS